MSDLREITAAVRRFAEEREWQPFHTPKNLAMALAGEAGELLALFQWLTAEESRGLSPARLAEVADEIADVQMYRRRWPISWTSTSPARSRPRWPRTR